MDSENKFIWQRADGFWSVWFWFAVFRPSIWRACLFGANWSKLGPCENFWALASSFASWSIFWLKWFVLVNQDPVE